MNVSFSDVQELEQHLDYIKKALKTKKQRKEGSIYFMAGLHSKWTDISRLWKTSGPSRPTTSMDMTITIWNGRLHHLRTTNNMLFAMN